MSHHRSWVETSPQRVETVLTCKEENTNDIRKRGINGLKYLFEAELLLLVCDRASGDKVSEPKGIES